MARLRTHSRADGRGLIVHCLAAPLYGPGQYMIDQATCVAVPANARTAGQIDVVVCTTGDDHLLDLLPARRVLSSHPDRGPPSSPGI